jgi:hypothetical protein
MTHNGGFERLLIVGGISYYEEGGAHQKELGELADDVLKIGK